MPPYRRYHPSHLVTRKSGPQTLTTPWVDLENTGVTAESHSEKSHTAGGHLYDVPKVTTL